MFKRVELYKALPLDTPFSVQISPSNHCNFRCRYCNQSLSDDVLAKKNFRREFMDFSLFKKLVDDITCFSKKIKAFIIVGYGEPLLHKNIVDMVDYAKRRDIADRVEIVTNGSLLTKEMSDALIDAGLDSLKVSIQGVDGDAYRATMGRKFDFDKFLAQLKYFFDHKKHTKMNCKIIDVAFRTKDEEQEFRRIFNPVCDETTIECEVPIIPEAENKSDFSTTRYGMAVKKVNICPPLFYLMLVHANGDVVPCCSFDRPVTIGNIGSESLIDIWNGTKLKQLRIMHLQGKRNKNPICARCELPSLNFPRENYLDGHEAALLQHYEV